MKTPIIVSLPPMDPPAVEAAIDEALAPFAAVVDEQWWEREDWRAEYRAALADGSTEQPDGEPDPADVVSLLAEYTGNEWKHEPAADGDPGRFFELTDDNPWGHWTSHEVGGGTAGAFALAPGADQDDPALVRGAGCPRGRADGGPLRLLDLEYARRAAAAAVSHAVMSWARIGAEHPGVRPLSDFEAELPPHAPSPAEAFEAQPQIALARAEGLVGKGEDPVVVFADPYALRMTAELTAVSGSALVDLDGAWRSDPDGCFRTFPRSEESLAHLREVRAYLDDLDDHCIVVQVTAHRG